MNDCKWQFAGTPGVRFTHVLISSPRPAYDRPIAARFCWRFALLVALFTPMGVDVHASCRLNGRWAPVRFVRRGTR